MEVHGGMVVHGGFDLGQTWVNETANRLLGVTYKNETGKPITVQAELTNNSTAYLIGYFIVDGVVLAGGTEQTTGYGVQAHAVVPHNSTYSINKGGAASYSLTKFLEYKYGCLNAL